jgi:hypothetical protein
MDQNTTYTGTAETHTNQSNSSVTTGIFYKSIQDNHTLHLNSTSNLTPEEQAIGTHTTTSIQITRTTHATHLEMWPEIESLKKHITFFQNLKQLTKKQKNNIYTSPDLYPNHLFLSSKQKEYPH